MYNAAINPTTIKCVDMAMVEGDPFLPVGANAGETSLPPSPGAPAITEPDGAPTGDKLTPPAATF